MAKIRVTLTLDVRDMTEEEFDAAGGRDHVGMDEEADRLDGEEGDPIPSPEGWVAELASEGGGLWDLRSAIEGALNSEDNPEMFAGTNLFLMTENAKIETTEWVEV